MRSGVRLVPGGPFSSKPSLRRKPSDVLEDRPGRLPDFHLCPEAERKAALLLPLPLPLHLSRRSASSHSLQLNLLAVQHEVLHAQLDGESSR